MSELDCLRALAKLHGLRVVVRSPYAILIAFPDGIKLRYGVQHGDGPDEAAWWKCVLQEEGVLESGYEQHR